MSTLDSDRQFLTFRVNNTDLCLPTDRIQEVITPRKITTPPQHLKHIRGVINLRGQVVTSISMRSLFGFEEISDEESWHIIIPSEFGQLSLMVDEVRDVIITPKSELRNQNVNAHSGPLKYGQEMLQKDEHAFTVLNLDQMIDALENKSC